MISVSIGAPVPAMTEHWDALERRAAANVFMNPVALCAAAATGRSRIHVLLARDNADGADKVVGFWALREHRLAPFCPAFLAAPPYDYSFVSSPVVDPDHADAVMPAFFDAIAADRRLPKVMRLKLLDAGAATFPPLMAALHARGGQILKLSERTRPFLAGESDRKRSGSTAKKLRQDWNRLCALGAADIVNDRAAAGAREAFEAFLQLELRSWKGANRTALLSVDQDAAFARRLISDLADHRKASVALLRVDGRPIAAQVLLYAGSMAYTWKIAFDADFAKYSPGALLIDKVTDELFATGTNAIESCSPEGSFMEQLWTGRRPMVDLLIDLGTEKSVGFTVAAMGEHGYAWLREKRNRLRAMNVLSLPKRKTAPAARG